MTQKSLDTKRMPEEEFNRRCLENTLELVGGVMLLVGMYSLVAYIQHPEKFDAPINEGRENVTTYEMPPSPPVLPRYRMK
ncbi:MAG: hypothetical protein RL557_116 [archaeon]|jgi:hypothetical protein